MKSQTTKMLFAFIIVMMFFSATQFANAQVHPDLNGGGGYFCYCANISLGCRDNVNCVIYCAKACKPKAIKIIRTALNSKSFTTIYPNAVSQSNVISFKLPQSEEINARLFENKKILKLKNNSQIITQQMEWGNADGINTSSN